MDWKTVEERIAQDDRNKWDLLVFWVVFTVISGSLFGSNATAFLHRRKAVPQTAS